MKAEKLPAHDFLDITFDLLILRSWDGSVEVGSDNRPGRLGPDIVRANLLDGPTLLYTTFSNRPDDPGFESASKFQNFPSPVAGDHLAPQTGAAAKNSLGYNYPWPGAPQPFPMDATYHIHLIVPHNAAGATLQLTGAGLQDIIDESWGVTNLVVQPLASDKVKTPDANAIASAFAECINPESDKQSEAFVTLVTGMDATVDWISANVSPQPIDSNRVADLIKLLAADDSNIDARESAATELRRSARRWNPSCATPARPRSASSVPGSIGCWPALASRRSTTTICASSISPRACSRSSARRRRWRFEKPWQISEAISLLHHESADQAGRDISHQVSRATHSLKRSRSRCSIPVLVASRIIARCIPEIS